MIYEQLMIVTINHDITALRRRLTMHRAGRPLAGGSVASSATRGSSPVSVPVKGPLIAEAESDVTTRHQGTSALKRMEMYLHQCIVSFRHNCITIYYAHFSLCAVF